MFGSLKARIARTGSVLYRAHERWIDSWFKGAGLADVRDHAFYSPLIGPDSVVVDLGANRGAFYSTLAGRYGCKCYAVEASRVLYEALPASPGSRKFNYAIARKDGDVEFFLSGNPEASSTNRMFADAWGTRERAVVKGVTLDTFLGDNGTGVVDLLKCDIEGSETELFASVSDEVVTRVRQYSVEFHDLIDAQYVADVVRIRKRLSALGYFSVTPTVPYSNANVLFIHAKACRIPGKVWLKLYVFKYFVLQSRRVWLPVHRKLGKRAKSPDAGLNAAP